MKTHRPLFWLCLAFMAGIMIETVWQVPFWMEIACLAVGIIGAALGLRRRWGGVLVLLAAAALGGVCAKNAAVLPRGHVVFAAKQFRGAEVALKGIVISAVELRPFGRGKRVSFTLAASEICREAVCRQVKGKVLVTMFTAYSLAYGDEVVLRGKLHRPFEFSQQGHTSYREYLRRRGILLALTVRKTNAPVVTAHGKGNCVTGWVLASRQALCRVYERYLTAPEAGLMNAFMLGERGNIPPHVMALFKKTGTAHVIAISGLNIAMLAFIIYLFFGILPVGRSGRTILTVVLLLDYSLFVGAGSPVVRSAVMSAIFLLSFLIEREQDRFNTLAAAALVILVADPLQLLDIGFQLSFACVAALLLWTPVLLGWGEQSKWRSNRVAWFFMESIAVSLAAWLGSIGLVAYYFGMITPVALLANLPVVPLMALVTALGVALLVVAFVLPPLAICVAACLKAALNLMVLVIWVCNLVPGGTVSVSDIPLAAVWIYYGVLLACFFIIQKMTPRKLPARDLWNAGL